MRDRGAEEGMSSFYAVGTGKTGATISLLPEEARHAAQVLRMKPGEEVFVVDEDHNRFAGRIEGISKTECTVMLTEELPNNESALRITLYQGVPKAEKLELVTQKLTELGAARIISVKMERCVVKLNEKDAEKRRERLERIAREAGKQCRRAAVPEIVPAQTWKQLRESMQSHDLLLVPWEDAEGFGMRAAFHEFPEAKDIGIVIGPEGGMSAEEVEALREIGARTITLGPRILRTETAAIAACTMAMTLWGDIG